MALKTSHVAPFFTGAVIAFVDFFSLIAQENFLMARLERLRNPTFADLSVVADRAQGGPTNSDLVLVTISIAADGSLYLDDARLAPADLAPRLEAIKAKPGTAFLYADPATPFGLALDVQRQMSRILARDIVTPLVRKEAS